MKKIFIFLMLGLIILVGFIFVFGFQEIKYFNSKADVSRSSFSIDNSYLFVSPLKATANGSEKIRVTVFVLNNQGLGVLGKKIHIGNDPKLNIDIIQDVTEETGKAIFDISSTTSGEYYLEIKVDDKTLAQRAHLSFN